MSDDKPKQPWTPGDWVPRYSGDGFIVDAETGPIAVVFGVARTKNGGVTGVTGNEGDDNAILMAASPVMAKVLAEIVTAFEGTQLAPDDGSSVRWVRLIRAVEKARSGLELAGWKWGGR